MPRTFLIKAPADMLRDLERNENVELTVAHARATHVHAFLHLFVLSYIHLIHALCIHLFFKLCSCSCSCSCYCYYYCYWLLVVVIVVVAIVTVIVMFINANFYISLLESKEGRRNSCA